MESPVPSIPDGPKAYQIEAVSAICRRGFDHKSLIAIARLECEQGRKGVYHYLNSYLDAIACVPIDEVSRWIHSFGLSVHHVLPYRTDNCLPRVRSNATTISTTSSGSSDSEPHRSHTRELPSTTRRAAIMRRPQQAYPNRAPYYRARHFEY